MPRIDFRDVPDPDDFTPVPDGTYLSRLVGVDVSTTKNGDEMWRMRFTIESGPYEGRSFFDNLAFSPAARPRAKLFCSAIGFDTSANVDLEPEGVLERRCRVIVQIEDYVDSKGATRQRNRVPYRGYLPLAATAPGKAELSTGKPTEGDNGDLPF